MNKKNKFDKLALGIFVDGLTLHITALCKQKSKIKLVDANIVNLASRLEPVCCGRTHWHEPGAGSLRSIIPEGHQAQGF